MVAERSDATVEMVDLADVRDDESWATDPADVESFRRSIRRGMQLPPMTFRRVWHDDASWHYEIIDGFHRYRAMIAEGVTQHLATVVECDTRTADYDRAQASLNKERPLLNQRAIQAIRQGFVRDMAAKIAGATIYEPVVDDDGTMHAVSRSAPLPSDPLMALGVLYDHLTAKPDATQDWEARIVAWLDEMCARFGKSREWLRDEVLGISVLVNDGVPGKNSAERARLLAGIPDVDIRRAVLGKLKREPKLADSRLRFALDWLGCGPDCGTLSWLPKLGRGAMQSRLSANTLDGLCNHYLQASQEASRPKPQPQPAPVVECTPEPEPERAKPFAVVSELFIPPLRPNSVIVPNVPPVTRQVHVTVSAPTEPVQVEWAAAHLAVADVLRLMDVFDKRGGDWTRDDVRSDLATLIERAQGYLARGE